MASGPDVQRNNTTAAAAPAVEEPAVAATPPAKQAANEQAADAAAQRMAGRPPQAQADNPDAPTIFAANAQSQVTLGRPAEMAVTAVAGDKPTFSGTVAIDFAEIENGFHGDVGIPLEELKSVTGVELFAGPDQAKLGFSVAGGQLVLTAAGLSSVQSLNASGFQVTLASGRSIALTLSIAQFHTDITVWRRAGIQLAIDGASASVQLDQQLTQADQDLADHPPPADVSHERGDLATAAANLAGTSAQIDQRVAALEAQWKATDPTVAAIMAGTLDGPSGPAADIGRAASAMESSAIAFNNSSVALAQKKQEAADIHDAFKDKLPDGLAGIDGEVAALEQKTAALGADLGQKRDAVVALLEANHAMLERLMASNESQLGQGPPPAAQATLQSLITLRLQTQNQVDRLNQAIAAKLAEPGLASNAARARLAGDADKTQQAQARLADDQKQLTDLKGPIFVMLGPDGQQLPDPPATK